MNLDGRVRLRARPRVGAARSRARSRPRPARTLLRQVPGRRRDVGSGTVLVLTAAALVALTGMVLSALAAVGVARHRAALVADLSALAAAEQAHLGPAVACAAAARVAASSAGRLATCSLTGDVAEVVAEVRPPGRLGDLGVATARARAGPVTSAPTAAAHRAASGPGRWSSAVIGGCRSC